MTKEELEKEAGNWLRKYLLCCNCEKKCNCIDSNSYCEEQVLKAYIDSAEPREKRIEELEREVKELQEENKKTFNDWLEACNKYGEVNLKLTKAKEIINDCARELQNILFYKMRNKERIASTLDKAEQFISEVEK